MKKIILISGKAEHGKTLVATVMKEKLESNGKKVLIIPFANYLKYICREYYDWDGKKNNKGRTILQNVGTDIVRKRSPDFWVKTVADFIDVFQDDFDYFIADDTRFENELFYLRDVGFSTISIRVSRVNTNGSEFQNSLSDEQRNHRSETELEGFEHDVYLMCADGIDMVRNTVFELIRDVFYEEDKDI